MWLRDMKVPTMLLYLFPTVVSLLAGQELHMRVKVNNLKHDTQLRNCLCRFLSQTLKQLTVVLRFLNLSPSRCCGRVVTAPASKSGLGELNPALAARQSCFSVAASSTPWSGYLWWLFEWSASKLACIVFHYTDQRTCIFYTCQPLGCFPKYSFNVLQNGFFPSFWHWDASSWGNSI